MITRCRVALVASWRRPHVITGTPSQGAVVVTSSRGFSGGVGPTGGIVSPSSPQRPAGAESAGANAGTSHGGKSEAEAAGRGINAVYGTKAADAYHSMLTTQGTSDALVSSVPPLPGRATARGTRQTMERSTLFENWHHVAAEPVGWSLSKIGCATCKMAKDSNESVDSLQLQIIKGLNVFEFDGSLSETFQSVARGFHEVLSAFELSREGIVVVMRCGIMRQPVLHEEQTTWEVNNIAAIRSRIAPSLARVQGASLPGLSMKGGFKFSDMSEEQLRDMNLRRIGPRTVAAITPRWLEAAISNIAHHTRIETIDVFLVEGIHTLFDGRPDEEIDADILAMFQFLESQVKHGVLQYYGLSSPCLAPPLPRQYPPLPPDAKVLDKYAKPYVPPPTINLHRVLAIAKKAAEWVHGAGTGDKHHFRFLSYPFNLTESQARGVKLDYSPTHTLCSLAKELGFTTLTHKPLEAPDLQDYPQRYHRFPLVPDLATARLNFFNILEKALVKEMEVTGYLQKLSGAPPLEQVLIASVYCIGQRMLSNVFHFDAWANDKVMPLFRRAISRIREGGVRDIKDWCSTFENLVSDMLRFRRVLFEHKHGLKTTEIDYAIDRVCPKLARCPIVSQKALNFALHGGDVCVAGLHQTRYFHEATELNPARDGSMELTEEEIQALCHDPSVSFVNYNPPHPYQMEPMPSQHQGKFSGQKSPSQAYLKTIDLKNPQWPDIAPTLEGGGFSPSATPQNQDMGSTSAPLSGPGTYPPDMTKMKKPDFEPSKTVYIPNRV